MRITPNNGRRIFGLLMILAGMGIMVGLVKEVLRARSRTSVAQAHILSAGDTMMGIGPLRHYSTSTRYEFFVNNERFESKEQIDSLAPGIIQVRFDPRDPNNSKLDLADSAPQFMGVITGFLLVIGGALVWDSFKPLAFIRPAVSSRLRK